MTFSATDGTRQASVIFQTNGTDLIITLENTSSGDALVPTDVLTALFFDVNGPALDLTRESAVLATGSAVFFGGTDPGGVVGGEWAYRSELIGPHNAAYGISASGFGLFGPGDRFPGSNLQGPLSLNGLDYGITSAGDDPATGNAAMTGADALITNAVVFTLSGVPAYFDPAQSICNVSYQYGTALSEPYVPEPESLALLSLGSLLMNRRR
jgi:hypothetical protein